MINRLDEKLIENVINYNETERSNVDGMACRVIISSMEKMSLLTLGYFSISKMNLYILDEVKKKIEQKIKDYFLNYNLISIQKLCLKCASSLSKLSFSMYRIDNYADTDIMQIFDILDSFGKNIRENFYQERMAFLKEAMDLIYFETEEYKNVSSTNITLDTFFKILYLEVSIILLVQFKFAISKNPEMCMVIDKSGSIRFEEKTANNLYKESKKLEEIKLRENENLYDSDANKVIKEFKKYYGFDNDSLKLISNFFLTEKNEIQISRKIFKNKVMSLLNLDDRQWKYFEKTMFFNSKNGEWEKMIKNVNCSLFSTPFVITKDKTKVGFTKYTIAESAMYLRRRIVYKDINLNRHISNLIKKLRNEKELPNLKKKLLCKYKNVGINKDFGEDVKTKEIFHNIRNVPHEIDLYYKDNENLKIFDLKDYHIPFSLIDLNKLEKKLKKETTKLKNLVSKMNENKTLFETSLGFSFKNIEVGILLTRDISNMKKVGKVEVISLSEFRETINFTRIKN